MWILCNRNWYSPTQGRPEPLRRPRQNLLLGLWRPPLFFCSHIFAKRLTPSKILRQKVTSKKKKKDSHKRGLFHNTHTKKTQFKLTNHVHVIGPIFTLSLQCLSKIYFFWICKMLDPIIFTLATILRPQTWKWRPWEAGAGRLVRLTVEPALSPLLRYLFQSAASPSQLFSNICVAI